MYVTDYLDPLYKYLPLVPHSEEVDDPANPNKKLRKVTLLRSYPTYPWLPDTGNHADEDPVKFIDICAQQGLVTWETKEQRERRLYVQGQGDGHSYTSYKDFLRDQPTIQNMPDGEGW